MSNHIAYILFTKKSEQQIVYNTLATRGELALIRSRTIEMCRPNLYPFYTLFFKNLLCFMITANRIQVQPIELSSAIAAPNLYIRGLDFDS